MTDVTQPAAAALRLPRWVGETFWTCGSVLTNAGMAFVVTRLLIRQFGAERYGLWLVVFASIDGYALLDLGLGAAGATCVAEARALGDDQRLARSLNWLLLCFVLVAGGLVALTLLVATESPSLFTMSSD